jgi:hypothetical protein
MTGGRPRGGSKLVSKPLAEADGREGTWTREQIETMDAEFVSAMQRAIANGAERAGEQSATAHDPFRR